MQIEWCCVAVSQFCHAVCCSVLQCVAVCCSALQCVAVPAIAFISVQSAAVSQCGVIVQVLQRRVLLYSVLYCSALQSDVVNAIAHILNAVCCSVVQCVAGAAIAYMLNACAAVRCSVL